jgi:hypothetical protein
VELVAKVEEEACRLARETAGVGKDEMGCDQEVGNIFGVDLSGDCFVVAGRASVAENSALVGSDPQEEEDGSVDRRVGGSEVMEGKMILGVVEDFRQVVGRMGGVADSDNRARNKLCRREEVVVRWWRVLRGAERADVNNGALESPI